jgi:hypothetical protein
MTVNYERATRIDKLNAKFADKYLRRPMRERLTAAPYYKDGKQPSLLKTNLLSQYDENDLSSWRQLRLAKIIAVTKLLGRVLAKSGVMRNKPLIPAAVLDVVFGSKLWQEHLHINQIVQTLLGNDVMDMLMRDMNKFRDMNSNIAPAWKPVPWSEASWFLDSKYRWLHSLHMSTTKEQEGCVAFAESLDKMKIERYTVMKAGRYLTRFFPELGDKEIKLWTEKLAASLRPAELKFVEHDNKSGWEEVYANGPDSCMSGDSADCVRVYAHEKSVLRLAYLMQGDDIKGRTIVREDKKEYIRCYPNTSSNDDTGWHNAMREAIEAAGYTHGSLNGVLLDVIETRDGWVMPYLDRGSCGGQSVQLRSVDGRSYFRVGEDGISATETCGYITEENQMCCDCCGESHDEDDMNYIDQYEHSVCNYCEREHYVTAIGRRGHECVVLRDDTVFCSSDDEYYVSDYASDNEVYVCEESGDYYKLDDMVHTPNGLVALAYATELDIKCELHGEEFTHAADSDVIETVHDKKVFKGDAVKVDIDGVTYWIHEDDDEDELRLTVAETTNKLLTAA